MDNFFLDEKGVWFMPPPNAQGGQSDPVWVCSPLEILAITRDHNNENHGKLLRFFDYDGIEHRWPMPMEYLAGDGTLYRQFLLSSGLQIKEGRQGRELLSRYIQSLNPEKRMRCVNKLGWYGNLYILPDETIGEVKDEEVVFQARLSVIAHHESKGTLEEWQKEVGKYCVDNSRTGFCVCVAFAAPLIHLLGEESGGFHLRGPSSGGKTTAIKVALSVYGGESMLHSWRATSNGLESIATLHNDCLLCLDEIGKLEPKIAGEVAYLLANGGGKQRCDKLGQARTKQVWRLLFLSNGELGLPDLIRQAGQKVRGGHEVRIVDIPAFTGAYGVFEHLHFLESGNEFSRMLCANTEKCHGTAGKAFIREIIKDMPKHVQRIKILSEKFKRAHTPPNADGQVLRVLNRFAVVAAAGTLATELGITGWPEDEANWATKQCFEAWLKNRGGISAQEGQEILRQVRHYFEQHGDSRFTLIGSTEEQRTINRAGYKRMVEGNWHYFVLPESFKQDICSGFDIQIATATLIERGWLLQDSEGKSTRAEYLPCSINSTTRCYRFDGNKIFSDEI
jgi:putative DNA primase/helicase